MPNNMPSPFWKLRVHNLDIEPSLTGLCVGYESEKWRDKQFVNHTMEWLPEFALKDNELEGIDSSNMIELVRKAAKRVYETNKFQNRGEFGELFLHMALRQAFNAKRIISKIYYKTALNDTVKGFDSVHAVVGEEGLELWLGEVKFYNNFKQAVRDVVEELKAHLETDYLRTEFSLILDKIDDDFEYADEVKTLMHQNTSLDDVFQRFCIPVFITYDSKTIQNNKTSNEKYIEEFENEINQAHEYFLSKKLDKEVTIHLFLFPLNSKSELISALDEKLKAWQSI